LSEKYKITATILYFDQLAWDLAQLLKRACFADYHSNAADDAEVNRMMIRQISS
jgi:hypothetical protein